MKPATEFGKLKLVLLDVDGVLTSGQIIHGDGIELKMFNAQDGLGMAMLRMAGLKTGVLTGRSSPSVTKRAQELKMDVIIQGARIKMPAFRQMLQDHLLAADEVCYMGDDLLDLAVLQEVGFSATPANGRPEVKERVHWVSHFQGGQGAVRELADLILNGRGQMEKLIRRMMDED